MLAILTVVVTLVMLWLASGNLTHRAPVPWVRRSIRLSALVSCSLVLGGAIVGGWTWGWLGAIIAFLVSFPVSGTIGRLFRPPLTETAIGDSRTSPRFTSIDSILDELRPDSTQIWGLPWRQGSSTAQGALLLRLGDPLTQFQATKDGVILSTRFTHLCDTIAHVKAQVDEHGLKRLDLELPFAGPDVVYRLTQRFGQYTGGMEYDDSDDFEYTWDRNGHWVGIEESASKVTLCFGRLDAAQT